MKTSKLKPRSASELPADILVICLSILTATFTAALMQNKFQKCATLMIPETLSLRLMCPLS